MDFSIAVVPTSSLIGVAIACSGNILISLALTVQKLAHRRQNEELVASRSASTSGESTPSEESRQTQADRNGVHDSPAEDSSRVASVVPVLLVDQDKPMDQASADGNATVQPGTAIPIQVDSIDLQRSASRGLGVVPEDAESSGQPPRMPGRIKIPPGYTTNIRIRPSSSRPQRSSRHQTAGRGREEPENGQRAGKDDKGVEEGMYLKSKLWWLGMVLIAVGEGGNFLSYGFAPASVVAPLGTVALIANCVFAPLILRETFRAKELIGMALAILGAVTVVWSSNSSNPRLDPAGLVFAIRQVPFIVYTSLNFALAIVLILLSRSQRYGGKYIAIDVGVCALFGGYTVLSTKALSSLLSTIFLSAFKWWITWVLVVVLAVTSVVQVKYLNRALMRFQSKEVIPTQFVFFSLAAIIGSAVLYQEFRDLSFSKMVNFAFGIATTFLGVHLLTSFSDPDSEAEGREEEERSEPPGPQRATSSASLNLLLPSTSRLTERTPLLIPVAEPSAGSAGNSSLGALNPGSGSIKGRLLKRTSTGDFTPTLGLSSQAGFLLMATTPPTSSSAALSARRQRSASQSQGPVYTDEERALLRETRETLETREPREGRGGQRRSSKSRGGSRE